MRIYLSGSMTIESDEGMLVSRDFPGRQGREAFAYLIYRDICLASDDFGLEATTDTQNQPDWWLDLADRLQIGSPE